jgi:hypothetical protein
MMISKKILTGLMLLSFFACNQVNQDEKNGTTEVEHTEEQAAAADTYPAELTLNKGSKWNTDESTRFHAANLNRAITAFNNKPQPPVAGYHSFAADLQKELGALVKACRMKGAEHEALHLWLGPVMKQTADLKSVSTAEEGKQVTQHLTTDIQKFNQYFEHAD